jgi:hypothetical protein
MKNHLPVLELIDRLCIARLKWRKIQENREELVWYENEWNAYKGNADLEKICNDLESIHEKIWDLESDLKQGVEDQVSLEEIGRRAIQIRNWNNQRIQLKNQASTIIGSAIREIKRDHLSE